MRRHPAVITDLPPSPEQDQRARLIRYGAMMGIRVICLALCFVVPGWWVLVPALGAVFLPYFAVVVGNAAARTAAGGLERPGGVVVRPPDDPR